MKRLSKDDHRQKTAERRAHYHTLQSTWLGDVLHTQHNAQVSPRRRWRRRDRAHENHSRYTPALCSHDVEEVRRMIQIENGKLRPENGLVVKAGE